MTANKGIPIQLSRIELRMDTRGSGYTWVQHQYATYCFHYPIRDLDRPLWKKIGEREVDRLEEGDE
jgi:hypothetical protein